MTIAGAAKVVHAKKGANLYDKRMEINRKREFFSDKFMTEFGAWEKTKSTPKFELSLDLKAEQEAIEQESNALKAEEEALIAERNTLYSVQGGRRKRGTRKVKRGKKGSRKGMRKGIRR